MKTIPPDKIEPMIFKLAYSRAKYINLLGKYFDESWFENPIYAKMINIVCKFYEKYGKLPKIKTLAQELSKEFEDKETRTDAVLKLQAVSQIDLNDYDEDYLDNEVVQYLKRNGLYQTLMESIDDIEKEHQVTCFDKLQQISSMTFDEGLGLDYFENFDEHCIELESPELRTSFGWKSLDVKTNGGMYTDGRCLITFVAETGMGKSLMLSNIAANWLKNGKFAIIISLEMSETVYATRIDAHLSEISMGDITENISELKTKIYNFKAKHGESKLVIKEYPPESISCVDIRNYIDTLMVKVGRKPDILLVDYINLVIPTGGDSVDNSYSKIGKVSRDLRALSYIYNCPVVSATQCNRDGYGTADPAVNNISESMGIAHTSDFIGQLYQNEGDRDAGILNMKITKNRFGGLIGTSICFDINYQNLIISDSFRNTIENELTNSIENEFLKIED